MVGFSGEVKLMTKIRSLVYINYIPNIGDGWGGGGGGGGAGKGGWCGRGGGGGGGGGSSFHQRMLVF
jgi:hypothetical protein